MAGRLTPTSLKTESANRPLIISDELDGSAALVIEELRRRNLDPFVFEVSRLSEAGVSITASYDDAGESAVLLDESKSERVRILAGGRILRRRPSLPHIDSYGFDDPAVATFISDQYRSAVNSLYALDVQWMNSSSADRQLDQNKLLGARIAHDVGLEVIPTVVTDDPTAWIAAVKRFGALGDLAVKAAGGWAARITGTESIASIFTTRLSPKDAVDLADVVRYAPTIVQPYVEKAFELRITMVDGEAFACRIDSQATPRTAVDWRHYDLDNTPHCEFTLSDELDARLKAFMTRAGLLYAGIDMIAASDGRLLFVEANPAGQFGWIEELTGLAISSKIADWLVGANGAG